MKRLLSWLLVLAIAVGIGLAARTWLFSAVRIAGSSMEDTLISGDVALVTRWEKPERGSVMQCTFTGRSGSYIKRVIGLPGDRIEFSDGQLIVNSRPLSEPYVSSETEDMLITLGAEELDDMIKTQHGAQVDCHFCNKRYEFNEEDLKMLLEVATIREDQ